MTYNKIEEAIFCNSIGVCIIYNLKNIHQNLIVFIFSLSIYSSDSTKKKCNSPYAEGPGTIIGR